MNNPLVLPTQAQLERAAIAYVRPATVSKETAVVNGSIRDLTGQSLVQRLKDLGWHPDKIELQWNDIWKSRTKGWFRHVLAPMKADEIGAVIVRRPWDISRRASRLLVFTECARRHNVLLLTGQEPECSVQQLLWAIWRRGTRRGVPR